uniref:C1 protein n=1 Tax=Tomato leaf curl betasatellite TaxID=220812 RepID=A0A161J2A9_9VIRU|nr:C1 protein [Tomato leaf curl betasatellite]
MTIHYTNTRGLKFIIEVRLQGPKFVMVKVQFFSTRAPAMIKRRFNIPYGHNGIILPFDFNGLETGIRDMIEYLYKDAHYEQFKQEELVEMIDILMMQDANVMDINVDVAFDVTQNATI